LDSRGFTTSFHPHDYRFVQDIERVLLPAFEKGRHPASTILVQAELYKLDDLTAFSKGEFNTPIYHRYILDREESSRHTWILQELSIDSALWQSLCPQHIKVRSFWIPESSTARVFSRRPKWWTERGRLSDKSPGGAIAIRGLICLCQIIGNPIPSSKTRDHGVNGRLQSKVLLSAHTPFKEAVLFVAVLLPY